MGESEGEAGVERSGTMSSGATRGGVPGADSMAGERWDCVGLVRSGAHARRVGHEATPTFAKRSRRPGAARSARSRGPRKAETASALRASDRRP
jgi:hypothetical protein